MTHADAKFSGSVPEHYDQLMGPFLFDPYARDLARRLPSRKGLRVLEIACGTGIVTRRLREQLPAGATLVATDLNVAMIDYARGKLGDESITWRQADAQSLPFEDASFDAAVCQFGFMFLPDKPQGFREARRVLADGGQLFASVWGSKDENPYTLALQRTLDRLFPDDPPRFLDTPFGFHDGAVFERSLREAGFSEVAIEDVAIEGVSPSAATVARGFALGSPLTHALLERGADANAVARAVEDDLVSMSGPGPFRAPLVARVATARR